MTPLEKLEDLGYIPLDVSLWEQNSLRYLRAQDKNGYIVYVDFQGEKITTVEAERLYKTQKIIAPYSLARGSLTCAEPESQAIAVECEGGVCIFSRENSFNLEERNYSCEKTFPHHRIPSSCPVIKYKELLNNPGQIEKCIETCSERISCSDIKFCDVIMEEMPVAIRQLNACWEKYNCLFCEKKKELIKSITELEKYKKDYECKGDTCNEKYKIIIFNLKKRREKLSTLVLLCKSLVSAKEALIGLSQELDSNIEWLTKEMANLCYVMNPC